MARLGAGRLSIGGGGGVAGGRGVNLLTGAGAAVATSEGSGSMLLAGNSGISWVTSAAEVDGAWARGEAGGTVAASEAGVAAATAAGRRGLTAARGNGEVAAGVETSVGPTGVTGALEIIGKGSEPAPAEPKELVSITVGPERAGITVGEI